MFEFTKATKTKAKARIALIGPSGSGKTYTALRIASGLGNNIAVIDTEHGSASKYADQFEFSTLELDQFSPEIYIQAIQAAEKAGFDVLIIDSLSHEWSGKGGALEMVDTATKRMKNPNSYFAWGDVTPLHNQFIDTIVGCKCHIIATMRSKTEYVIETVNNKSVPRKVGMAPIQRDGMEYEYDIVGELDLEHNLIITKTRFISLDGQVVSKPDEAFGETVKAWLSDGKDAPPPHWSDKLSNRQHIEGLLAQNGIAIETLFTACQVKDWSDMRRFEGEGKDAFEAAKALHVKPSGKGK